MKILGLQKMTLLDYPSKVACTVFLGGCNFRCPFCHNASVVLMNNEEISTEEFFSFLEKRKKLLDGVCITGGEPLVNGDTEDFIAKIHKMGYLVKLDTNGSFPERLKKLIDGGLIDYIAMDIKNSAENYEKTAGVEINNDAIDESIRIIKESGVPYEFRTTVVKGLHTDEDFRKIGERIKGAEAYYLQKFRNSEDLLGGKFEEFSDEDMERFAEIVSQYVKNTQLRGM